MFKQKQRLTAKLHLVIWNSLFWILIISLVIFIVSSCLNRSERQLVVQSHPILRFLRSEVVRRHRSKFIKFVPIFQEKIRNNYDFNFLYLEIRSINKFNLYPFLLKKEKKRKAIILFLLLSDMDSHWPQIPHLMGILSKKILEDVIFDEPSWPLLCGKRLFFPLIMWL